MPEDVLSSLPQGTKIIPQTSKNVLSSLPKDTKILGVQQSTELHKNLGSDKLNNEYTPTPDQVLESVKTDNDHEKEMLKNLALKVNEGKASHEDLRDAILTVQGQHKNQGGEKNYYVEDKGGVMIPKPLAKNEKAPNNTAEIFNETNWAEDLGNSLLRGSSKLGAALAKTPAFIYDVAAIPQNYVSGLLGGEQVSSGTFKETFGLPENKVAQYYDEQTKINQDNFNQKYDKGITDYVSKGEYGKAFGLLGNSILESAPTTIGLAVANAGGVGAVGSILGGGAVFGAEKKGELDKNAPNMAEDKKVAVALSNGLFEGIFEQFGITKLGGITKDALLRSGKEEAYKLALDGFKETYRPVITKYLGTSAEEALGEAATQFAQNAVDKYSGYKPDLNLSDGVADAAIIGFGAGAGYGLVSGATTEELHKRKVERAGEQNKKIFDIVKSGNEAVTGFKAEIFNAVKNGNLNQSEGDKAITKINAFKDYNDMLGSLPLEDGDKRTLFDLSFQKQGIETELDAVKDPKKLNPIEQAQYSVKEKIANDIQKHINEIVLKAQVKEETNLPNKTIEDVVKAENPKTKSEGEKKLKVPSHIQAILDRQKETSKKEKPEDKRSYNDVPLEEFNKRAFDTRKKHAITHEDLMKQPNQMREGVVLKRGFGDEGNHVFEVEMNDNKKIQFSSSQIRDDEWKDSHLTHALDETIRKKEGEYWVIDREKLANKPVALKAYTIENDGRKKNVIKIYNPHNGKFIAWAKETHKGKNDITDKEVNGENGLIDIERKIEPIIPPSEGEVSVTPKKPTPVKPLVTKETVEQEKEAELKSARKPDLKLNFIKDSKILDKVVNTKITNNKSGEQMDATVKVSKVQSYIKKKLKNLELLNNCIHGS